MSLVLGAMVGQTFGKHYRNYLHDGQDTNNEIEDEINLPPRLSEEDLIKAIEKIQSNNLETKEEDVNIILEINKKINYRVNDI